MPWHFWLLHAQEWWALAVTLQSIRQEGMGAGSWAYTDVEEVKSGHRNVGLRLHLLESLRNLWWLDPASGQHLALPHGRTIIYLPLLSTPPKT